MGIKYLVNVRDTLVNRWVERSIECEVTPPPHAVSKYRMDYCCSQCIQAPSGCSGKYAVHRVRGRVGVRDREHITCVVLYTAFYI